MRRMAMVDRGRRRAWWRVMVVLWLVAGSGGAAWGQEVLPVLARIGPWPVAGSLIGYGDRLWLVNSVTGVNHNSAEIYSYDPVRGAIRYERHLFSQDSGHPLVSGGLLYWPFEDSRFSNGWGHYMVTDGVRWSLGTIPSARIFHIHAMADLDGLLVAATSAWRAGLQLSDDRGRTWREAYDHPTAERRVSRITDLVAVGDNVIGTMWDPSGRRLLRFDGRRVSDLPGWPRDAAAYGIAAFDGAFYGLVGIDDGVAVWRSDGSRSEQLTPPRKGWRTRGLASGPSGLWVASAEGTGGLLWHSPDGREWRVRYRLEGGEPRNVLLYGGRPYVAGAGQDGRGILWGPAPPAPVEPPLGPSAEPAAAWPGRPAEESGDVDWPAAGDRLDRALASPASYDDHAGTLRDLVYRAAIAGPPPGFLAARLAGPFPDRRLPMIGGNTVASAGQLARWTLLWGMALSGQGRVPPALIAEPWTMEPNSAEKYFATAPAAMWAAAAVGQADRATVAALIGRLDRPGDPAWLTGDAVGALTALTGERFGHDTAGWRAWWAENEASWPE